jgi:dethiobiotin synthetase
VRGLFVTGTDTGVGKTVLSAALLAAMAAAGERVRAFKPVVTGLDEQADADARDAWPADHILLGVAAGMAPEDVSPLLFGPAISPHLAAALAGQPIDPQGLIAAARASVAGASGGEDDGERTLIVEGVGGLLVPLREDYSVCDLAVALGLPLLIAARPGLGTINHTLLTLRAARAAGLDVRAIVLTPWPGRPSAMESSNRETIARIGEVEVGVLGRVESPVRADLARAGATLAWHRWLRPALA